MSWSVRSKCSLALCLFLGFKQSAAEELAYFDDVKAGMSREEIVEMIGEPDRGAAASDIEIMIYYLPGGGRQVDPKCLEGPGPGPSAYVQPQECDKYADILVVRLEGGTAVVAAKMLDTIDLELSIRTAIRVREEQRIE